MLENQQMKYVNPLRLKVLLMLFFGTGLAGIVIGLTVAPAFSSSASIFITFLGVINLSLGAFFGWIFFTQKPDPQDPRKRKRKKK